MKHNSTQCFVLIVLIASTCSGLIADTKKFGFPFFKQRSQILNLPRRMVGEVHHLYRTCLDDINGNISITPTYSNNFKRKSLGNFLFFNGTNTMKFGPAGAADTDVYRQEFVLGEGFQGTITTKPKIQNFIVDFAARIGFDNWVHNLYLDVRTPINWTKWSLQFKETPISAGTGMIAQGQMGNNDGSVAAPFTCITQSWQGDGTVADLRETMSFALVDGPKAKVRLADIELAAGYNIVNCPGTHFGLNLRFIVPTGNRPKGTIFFEPIAGGGKHTFVGGGLDGHVEFYHDCCKNTFISLYYFGTIYHMFGATQKRTFDLKQNGIGSRYLLFKRFDAFGNYDNTIIRGPNVLTLDATVNVKITGEAVILFSFEKNNMSFDTGYNLWGRSREKIKKKEEILDDTFGIKGNTNTLTGPLEQGQVSSRNQTASTTRINGANADIFDTQAVFITTDDLDFEGAEHPSTLSHTLFGHVSFAWEYDEYLSYFFGFGGDVEFSGRGNTALNQWNVWTKGGIFFS